MVSMARSFIDVFAIVRPVCEARVMMPLIGSSVEHQASGIVGPLRRA